MCHAQGFEKSIMHKVFELFTCYLFNDRCEQYIIGVTVFKLLIWPCINGWPGPYHYVNHILVGEVFGLINYLRIAEVKIVG